MRIIITLEYIIKFVVLALYYMHMFQLNSYFFKNICIGQTQIKRNCYSIFTNYNCNSFCTI